MNIPKQAIEKSIEGGYELPNDPIIWKAQSYAQSLYPAEVVKYYPHIVALDPAFWQALGKALGWKNNAINFPTIWRSEGIGQPNITHLENWNNAALTFYDLILTGGDTDNFWKEILQQ